MSKKDIKEQLMEFILQKVKQETSKDKPYFILKWSGLAELCKAYGQDLLEIVDTMVERGLVKKALLPSKKDKKKKLLAIYLPNMITSDKTKKILNEFESFIKQA